MLTYAPHGGRKRLKAVKCELFGKYRVSCWPQDYGFQSIGGRLVPLIFHVSDESIGTATELHCRQRIIVGVKLKESILAFALVGRMLEENRGIHTAKRKSQD